MLAIVIGSLFGGSSCGRVAAWRIGARQRLCVEALAEGSLKYVLPGTAAAYSQICKREPGYCRSTFKLGDQQQRCLSDKLCFQVHWEHYNRNFQ